jgi:RNA polymerase sigma factor (TIGR02999 family)
MSQPRTPEKPASPDKGLLELVYDELRGIARARLAAEAPGHTLGATALVHEAYLKLCSRTALLGGDKADYFRAAATAMRQILIDHARTKKAEKRGGALKREFADVAQLAADGDSQEILALDDALLRLEREEPTAAEVVKLRFYGGLSVEETAQVMGISDRSVKREWQFARAWLYRELQ